jgi:hypothetical protein
LSLLALGFVACKDETVDSEDVRTSGIHAEFDVLATGNAKAVASGKLTVGTGNTSLVLTGADKIVVTQSVDPAADDIGSKTATRDGDYYRATFSGEAGGTRFIFAFERGDEDEVAPDSNVTLPDPFTLTGPGTTTEVSRATGVTATWEVSATADPMTWTLEGACLFKTDGSVPTDGTVTLKGDDFDTTPSADDAVADDKDDSENCTATLCIFRKRTGTLDAAFDKYGGSVKAVQQRCTKFVSVP